MNEFQVVLGKTTFGGRPELQQTAAIVDYGSLMYTTLERARTAREAIQIMGDLVAEYGYAQRGRVHLRRRPQRSLDLHVYRLLVQRIAGSGEVVRGGAGGPRRAADARDDDRRPRLLLMAGDRCCGSLGTALAQELLADPLQLGDDVRVWRTSHTGGHRFAPTALVLPQGTVVGLLRRAGACQDRAPELGRW